MIHPVDSIIFDVDGTLWDAVPVMLKAWNQAVEAATGAASRIQLEAAYATMGMTLEDIAKSLFPEMNWEERQALMRACLAQEDLVLKQTVPPLFSGVRETLEELAGRYPLYIVSNCQLGYVDRLVEGHGLQGIISDWLCWGDTLAEKDVTLRTLVEKHHLQHPVYVGDTLGDQRSCAKAGIPFIFAAYGFGRAEQPAYTIQRFADLRELV